MRDKKYRGGGPLICRGYPLLDDPPAHRARAAKRRWLKALSTPGWKRVRRLQKAHSKKHFTRFCALFTHRTQNETYSQTTRIQHVIFFTSALHSDSRINKTTYIKQTFAYATTRETLPEASPKGPGTTHLRALASKRTMCTLVTQGLASTRPTRPPLLEKQKPSEKQQQQSQKTQNHTIDPIIS